MVGVRKLTLYIDRINKQWIVRDEAGKFWLVPSAPDAWDKRQPYSPGEDTELEFIPAHYQHTLGLPT